MQYTKNKVRHDGKQLIMITKPTRQLRREKKTCPDRSNLRHHNLIKQQIHLPLHAQYITSLGLFDLVITDPPPPIMLIALFAFQSAQINALCF